MIVQILRWWLRLFTPLSVLTWLIGAVAATLVTAMYYSVQPPGTLLSISEDSELSRSEDGKLVLVLHVNRTRYCATDTRRWLFRYMTRGDVTYPVFYSLGNIPSPPLKLGDELYGIALPIPAEWDRPGTAYVSRTDYHCGLGDGIFNPQSSESPPLMINEVKK